MSTTLCSVDSEKSENRNWSPSSENKCLIVVLCSLFARVQLLSLLCKLMKMCVVIVSSATDTVNDRHIFLRSNIVSNGIGNRYEH